MKFKLLIILALIFSGVGAGAAADMAETEKAVFYTPPTAGAVGEANDAPWGIVTGTTQSAEATAADGSLSLAANMVIPAKLAIKTDLAKFSVAGGAPAAQASVLSEKIVAIENAITACQSASKYARICIAGENPGLLTAAGAVGLILNSVTQMKSMSDSCSKMNDALKIAKDALTVFNAACGVAQYNCSDSCGVLTTQIQEAGTYAGANAFPLTEAKIESLKINVAPTTKVCQSYKLNAAAGGIGVFQMVTSSMKMSNCQQALTTVDCVKDPANAQCPQALDCSKPANAQNANCICKANPNSPGCPGAVVMNGAPPAGTGVSPVTAATNLDPGKYTGSSLSGVDSISPTGSDSSKGGSLGAGGGGGLGGGGGGGTGGAKDAKGADGKKGLNANILGGFDGGGGGGGVGGRSGSSGAANSALQAYMPGGAKDPSRGLASQTFGNGEVTGAGSKSNWEKISDRYLDNKPTLMGP